MIVNEKKTYPLPRAAADKQYLNAEKGWMRVAGRAFEINCLFITRSRPVAQLSTWKAGSLLRGLDLL